MKNVSLCIILILGFKSYSANQCVDLFMKSTNPVSQSNAYTESAILSTLDGLVELKFQIDSGNIQDTQIKQAHEKLRRDLSEIIKIDRKYLQIFNEKMKVRIKELAENENIRRREEREREEAVRQAIGPFGRAKKIVFHEILPGKFPMLGALKPVIITKAFELAQTQTTQLQWSMIQVLIAKHITKNLDQLKEEQINPSNFKNKEESQIILIEGKDVQMQPDHPVEEVRYEDVVLWIKGLNQLSKMNNEQVQKELRRIIPGHKQGHIYDLPTEAQWAFVKQNRGKNNEAYFDKNDDSELDQYAWHEKNANRQTHAVATKLPRKIDRGDGLFVDFYDLEGNVWEWVKDVYEELNKLQGGTDPQGPNVGIGRVMRGGSWDYDSNGTRSDAGRNGRKPMYRTIDIGFRLSRTLP